MVQIRTRKLFVLYVSVTTIAFIWLYSKSGESKCKEEELEELIDWYKWKNAQLQGELDDTKRDLRISKKITTKTRAELSDESRNKRLTHELNDVKDHLKECQKKLLFKERAALSDYPVIYLVTPTYAYSEQKANLIGLSHTLLHLKNVHWILIEDSFNKTSLVTNFLVNSGITYTHLNVETPPDIKLKQSDPTWLKPKGVLQRNAALRWLRQNLNPQNNGGVVYFADDDNTYSLDIFNEMRFTNKVAVWPVGLVGGLRYEKPYVTNGKVTSWLTYWKPERPFPMDMAGFAINLKLFFDSPNAWFSNAVPRGYLESTILEQLHIKMADLEPKADNCSKVLVWHTRTEKTKLKNEQKMIRKFGHGTDNNIEV